MTIGALPQYFHFVMLVLHYVYLIPLVNSQIYIHNTDIMYCDVQYSTYKCINNSHLIVQYIYLKWNIVHDEYVYFCHFHANIYVLFSKTFECRANRVCLHYGIASFPSVKHLTCS